VYPVLPAPNAAHFEADNTIFLEEFRIRGNEAGPDQRANIITIANLLQVCASRSTGTSSTAAPICGFEAGRALWIISNCC
jgi:hypothetical protein